MTLVPGRGNRNAKLAIIGEAPGAEEIRLKEPFRGPSGRMLDNLLGHNGISESEIYVDNVCQSPPSGRNPTIEEIKLATPGLRARLRDLPNLNCILAVGNIALQALSVFQYSGITKKYRGSILPVRLLGKQRPIKMVPIVHPAWIMKDGNYEFRFFHISIGDVARAKEEALTSGIRRPIRNHRIIYNFEEAVTELRSLRELNSRGIPWSFDVETSLPCLGFGTDRFNSFTIPFESVTYPHIWPEAQRQYLINEVKEVFVKGAKIVTQNGFFDKRVLWKDYGINPLQWDIYADTMHMHQLLYSELPHSLAFLCSVYTLEPFYKDEGANFRRGIDDENGYFVYNGKDCCVTLECFQEMEEELDDIGHNQKDYFYQVLMPALNILFRMHVNGVYINPSNHKLAISQLKRAETIERIRLIRTSGQEPNSRSPIEMEAFLQGLGVKAKDLPRTPKTNKIQLTEDIFDRLYAKYGFKELASIIKLRKNLFLQSGFTRIDADSDGRYRIVFKLGPKSGRLASEGEDKGPQLQNIPAVQKGKPNLRSPYAAPEGKVLISADLEAADTRSLAYYAPELTFIKIFESEDSDIHSQVACEIFGLQRKDISKHGPHAKERSVSKVIGHGSNYGMGPRRVVNTLRDNGIFISESEAKKFQSAYFARFSGIKPYHLSVQKQIRSSRAVFDLTGRRHVFLGFIDDKLFQEAYSRPPQATVAGVMLKGMILLQNEIDLYDWQQNEPLIIIQVHDELILECLKEHSLFVASMMRRTMSIPLTAHERTFIIPMEINIGSNWGELCPLETWTENQKSSAGLANTCYTQPRMKHQMSIISGQD